MIMLDTNHFLSFDPSFLGSPPEVDDMEKAGLKMDHDRLVYHSLKEGGQSVTHADVFDIVFLCVLRFSYLYFLWHKSQQVIYYPSGNAWP